MDHWSGINALGEGTGPTEVRLTLQSLLFNYHDEGVKPAVGGEVVKSGLYKLHRFCDADVQFQIKWCQLAVAALNSSQCKFSTSELNTLVGFVMGVSKTTNFLYCTVEALGALLYNADVEEVEYLEEIIGEDGMMIKLCQGVAPEKEVQHLAFRCLNNLLPHLKDEVYLLQIVQVLTQLSHYPGATRDNINRTRISLGIMRCFLTIAKAVKLPSVLEQILSTIKGNMFEGIGKFASPAISLESLSLEELSFSDTSTKQSQPRVRMKKGRNKKKKPFLNNDSEEFRKRKGNTNFRNNANSSVTPATKGKAASTHPPSNHTATPLSGTDASQMPVPVPLDKDMGFESKQTDFTVSTSESEYSESDTEEGILNKVAGIQARVRFSSLVALQHCISNIHKTSMYSVWCAFLPPDSDTGLLSIVRKESNLKCRIAALGALSTLIDSCKHYFLAADSHIGGSGQARSASFTPFSLTLANALTSLHNELLDLLPGCHPGILPHLLQCLAVLVVHTPYSKLHPNLITKVLDETCVILVENSNNTSQLKVQTASLNVFCACFTVETPLLEVKEWLNANGSIMKYILESMQYPSNYKDGLQVICRLLRFYFTSISTWWTELSNQSRKLLELSTEVLIQNMSLLVLEELGKALSSSLEREELDLGVVKAHWVDILQTVIVPIIQDEASVLAPGSCDILSTIGNMVFGALETHTQRLIMTLVLALTHHPTITVVSSACRCLGVFVTYPVIRDDLLFVADTANAIIRSLEDRHAGDVSLVLRVSWSLGNLSDTLVANKSNNPMFVNDFSDLLLGRLFEVCMRWVGGNDKIKSNIVRALGNLLKFIKKTTYEKVHFMDYVASGVKCLLQAANTGMMKTRWNACYALVNTLQNPVLNPATSTWGEQLFTTLEDVIRTCKNYKVRINAALALAQCPTRTHYGDFFLRIWGAALASLTQDIREAPANMVGYSEKLRLQLLLLLCHLVLVHEPADRAGMVRYFPFTSSTGDEEEVRRVVVTCARISNNDTLTPVEVDCFGTAIKTCGEVGSGFTVFEHMLTPVKLPSDAEAFVTSDISKK